MSSALSACRSPTVSTPSCWSCSPTEDASCHVPSQLAIGVLELLCERESRPRGGPPAVDGLRALSSPTPGAAASIPPSPLAPPSAPPHARLPPKAFPNTFASAAPIPVASTAARSSTSDSTCSWLSVTKPCSAIGHAKCCSPKPENHSSSAICCSSCSPFSAWRSPRCADSSSRSRASIAPNASAACAYLPSESIREASAIWSARLGSRGAAEAPPEPRLSTDSICRIVPSRSPSAPMPLSSACAGSMGGAASLSPSALSLAISSRGMGGDVPPQPPPPPPAACGDPPASGSSSTAPVALRVLTQPCM